MLVNSLSLYFFFVTSTTASAQTLSNITYSVIASPNSDGQTLAVVVDNNTWPLTSNGNILYQGEAPIAQQGYHYAILENDKRVNMSEAFDRSPSLNNTFNEFFNRTWNTFNKSVALGQTLPPLSSINRIKSDLHIYNQIPTINIWGNATAIDFLHNNQKEDIDVELNMTYIGLKDVETFENVKVSLSGRSSRLFSKLSYGLKLKKKNDDNLFGFKNIKLRALAYDPSFVREYVAYSVVNSVGLAASELTYVRVFMNNKPVGLYGLIETFQDPWPAIEFANGDKSYNSGYLYQALTIAPNQTVPAFSDLTYFPNLTYYSAGEYKIKAGPSKTQDQDFLDLQEFTKFISEASDNTTVEEWNTHLDVDGFMRAMALEDLLGFSDAYMTLMDNYYLYSDPKSKRMTFIPSDLDTTLGVSLYDMDLMLSGNYSEHPGFTFQPLTKKFFSNKALLAPYEQLILKLTQTLINPTVMNPYIDTVIEMIRSDIDWDGSLPRLGQSFQDALAGVPAAILPFFPHGLRTNWTDPPQTFESSLNGPTNSNTTESVKGFIKRKSEAVLAFFNQTKSP